MATVVAVEASTVVGANHKSRLLMKRSVELQMNNSEVQLRARRSKRKHKRH
jgi:hypothetical protein